MRWNGAAARKLSIGVHTSHSIGQTIAGRTCRHVVGVKCSARAAAGSNGKVLFAVFNAEFFVSACNGVLEAGGVG